MKVAIMFHLQLQM